MYKIYNSPKCISRDASLITYSNIRTFCLYHTVVPYLLTTLLHHSRTYYGLTTQVRNDKKTRNTKHGWPTERPTTKNPPLAREWTTVRRWAKYLRRDPHRYSDIVSVPAGLGLTRLLRFDRSAVQSALAAHDKWIPRCCNMCGGSTGVRAHVVKC